MKNNLIIVGAILFTLSPVFAMESEINDSPTSPRTQLDSFKDEKNEFFQNINTHNLPLTSTQSKPESLENKPASLIVPVGWEHKQGTRKFSLGKKDEEALKAIKEEIVNSTREKAEKRSDVVNFQRGRKVSRTIPLERHRKNSGSSKRSTKFVSSPLTNVNPKLRENGISPTKDKSPFLMDVHKCVQIASPEDSSKEESSERDTSPIRHRKEPVIIEEVVVGRLGSLPPPRERKPQAGLSLNK